MSNKAIKLDFRISVNDSDGKQVLLLLLPILTGESPTAWSEFYCGKIISCTVQTSGNKWRLQLFPGGDADALEEMASLYRELE
jgi:hypothetical protein